ncbi:MAG TPA: hypothetical protein VLM89_17485 [Phycisphaerae bacterium]|nr:hypothetical protein [Phycisphaerae bacterium]
MAACVAFLSSPVIAHPLGNDSITHFSALRVDSRRFEVDLILDIAETPAAVLLREEIDTDHDEDDTPAEQENWLNRKADELAGDLRMELDGKPVRLRPIAPEAGAGHPPRLIIKMLGVAGMPTYRIMIRYAADWPASPDVHSHTLVYEDTTFPNHRGLKRILLRRAEGVTIDSPRPPYWDECEIDPFIYDQYDPGDMPDEQQCTLTFRVVHTPQMESTPATQAATSPACAESPDYHGILTDPRNDPSRQSQARRDADRLIALLQQPWGITMFLTVTALCFVWGAAHALMPGHAKTLVAGYLISRHGSWRHAVVLAVVVTFTHSALVVIVGTIIWIYQRSHPDLGPAIQIRLGAAAGLLVAGMGFSLLWRGVTGRSAHDHHHDHHHSHDHDHAHPHRHPHVHAHESDKVTTRLLLMLGITGGIVPCPTAMIIMLLGIGANVVLGALYAVGVFSLGLALTLMAVGMAALASRRVAARLMTSNEKEPGIPSPSAHWLLNRLLPALSGLAVLLLGAALTAHYMHYLRTGRGLFEWLG